MVVYKLSRNRLEQQTVVYYYQARLKTLEGPIVFSCSYKTKYVQNCDSRAYYLWTVHNPQWI